MADPFEIYIGGQKLQGWTSATLTRSKEQLTGSLNVVLFFNYMPSEPVARQAVAGADVNVYVGGKLAFTGEMDTRTGKGDETEKGVAGGTGGGSGSRSVNIGPDSYTVTLSARGKTKRAIESSHQHQEGMLVKTTDKAVLDAVLKGSNITVDWQAAIVQLDKYRMRDGAIMLEEMARIGVENGHYLYEDRFGKLRVTDNIVGQGEHLILGENIVTFSASQSQSPAKKQIIVKGHLTDKTKRGKAKIEDRIKVVTDAWATAEIPITIQHYGNATDEALERRGKYEADTRAQDSKNVTIEVFHVQPRSGDAWDIGLEHYVEIPPEGLFEGMECVGITYKVADKKLSTTLTLAPPPSAGAGGSFSALSSNAAIGNSRRTAAGITLANGTYPDPWGGAEIGTQSYTGYQSIINTVETPIDKFGKASVPETIT